MFLASNSLQYLGGQKWSCPSYNPKNFEQIHWHNEVGCMVWPWSCLFQPELPCLLLKRYGSVSNSFSCKQNLCLRLFQNTYGKFYQLDNLTTAWRLPEDCLTTAKLKVIWCINATNSSSTNKMFSKQKDIQLEFKQRFQNNFNSAKNSKKNE